LLARAGVGHLRLIDRDIVELTNLHRQLLYTQADAAAGLPKAEAAALRLAAINSDVDLQPLVADVTPKNIDQLLSQSQVVIDATDNAQTRYLLNDWCVSHGVPWVYGAGLAWEGRAMGIVPAGTPGHTPCLRCIFRHPPPAGELETCQTAGVLPAVTATVASLQAGWVLRWMAGLPALPLLSVVNMQTGRLSQIDTGQPDPTCPACHHRRFEFLDAASSPEAGDKLCGRNTVQIRLASGLDLDHLTARLSKTPASAQSLHRSRFMVRLSIEGLTLTCFADGRVLVAGVSDVPAARSAVARWVGL
jgi:adenylyltransferase/sulfurtransferase